jgi:hypothetical protein
VGVSVKWAVPVSVAALAFGGLAVAVAPSAAACGGYGEPACQTFTLSFNANGGVCSPSSVSATENTWATLLSGSQCTRSGFTLSAWSGGGSSFAPGAQVFVTGNNGFTAVWTATTPTSSPGTPTGGQSTGVPTTGPTESPTATPTPTVTIPAGQTNPTTPQRPAPGVVVVTQAVADRTEATDEFPRNTRRAAESNAAEIDRGSVFQAAVQLVGRTPYSVRLQTPEGEFVSFGSLRTNALGVLTTPAVRYTLAGTYFWVFEFAGRRQFIAVSVS